MRETQPGDPSSDFAVRGRPTSTVNGTQYKRDCVIKREPGLPALSPVYRNIEAAKAHLVTATSYGEASAVGDDSQLNAILDNLNACFFLSFDEVDCKTCGSLYAPLLCIPKYS